MAIDQETKDYLDTALTSALKGSLGEFQKYFKEQLSPINERLSAFEAVTPATPPASPGTPETPESTESALLARLAQLEASELSRVEELKQMKLDKALGDSVGKHNPLHADVVRELLATRYGSKAVEKNGEWYLPNGSKLSEEVDTFFGSEAGLHFLPNPAGESLGTKATKAPAASGKAAKDITSDDMFEDWTLA
jgi:hypothetical protein